MSTHQCFAAARPPPLAFPDGGAGADQARVVPREKNTYKLKYFGNMRETSLPDNLLVDSLDRRSLGHDDVHHGFAAKKNVK